MNLVPYREFVRAHAPRNERTSAGLAIPLRLTRNAADTAYLPDVSGASAGAKVRRLAPAPRVRVPR